MRGGSNRYKGNYTGKTDPFGSIGPEKLRTVFGIAEALMTSNKEDYATILCIVKFWGDRNSPKSIESKVTF